MADDTEEKINRLTSLSEIPEAERKEELLRQQIAAKDGHITMLEDALKSREEEMTVLKNRLKLADESTHDNTDMKSSISSQDDPYVKELKEIISKQNRAINEFRGSVLFPFYRLTHRIGRTKIGNKVEKSIKRTDGSRGGRHA